MRKAAIIIGHMVDVSESTPVNDPRRLPLKITEISIEYDDDLPVEMGFLRGEAEISPVQKIVDLIFSQK